MQQTEFFVCRGNVGASVEVVVRAPELKHERDLGEWHRDLEEIDPEWWVPIATVREWLGKEVNDWKKKLPPGLGGYVENLSPEEVYDMILDREFSIEDLHDWLKHRAMEEAQKDMSQSLTNLSITDLDDEGYASDFDSELTMRDWDPLDYSDGNDYDL
jgi:hypothetical protein